MLLVGPEIVPGVAGMRMIVNEVFALLAHELCERTLSTPEAKVDRKET
jgi:hypothetical protein